MAKKEMICICCPLGCMLTVTTETEGNIVVTGNSCPRGVTYAKLETTDPRRIVTSTVRVKNASAPIVSVKTREGIPKDKIIPCIEELADIELEAPVCTGDVIAVNIAGTGVDVVATKSIRVAT